VHKTKTNQPGVDTLLEYVLEYPSTRVLELFNIAIAIASRIFGGQAGLQYAIPVATTEGNVGHL
jgi:hypothetical protein